MTDATSDHNPRQVLIVDDDDGDVLLIEEALRIRPTPVGVHIVRDGRTALAFLRRLPPYDGVPQPTLVLLDVHMPRWDGLDVLTAIKSDPDLTAIPVVMFSASTAPHHIAGSYARHANAYVVKPVSVDQFFATVELIVGFYTETAATPAAEPP